MIYRELGRTGLKVSQLGFGAMRLPLTGDGPTATVNRALAIPMIHRAFAAGVNYIGLWEPAQSAYRSLVDNHKAADRCHDCGACEEKCPQDLSIRRQLAQAHAALVPAPRDAHEP